MSPPKDFAHVFAERNSSGRLDVGAPLPKFPGWMVLADVDDGQDPPSILGLCIRQGPDPLVSWIAEHGGPVVGLNKLPEPAPTLTHDILRSVQLTTITAAVNRALAPEGKRLRDPSQVRAKSDEYFARWAARYVRLIDEGERYPNAVLADRHGLTSAQVRDLIHACRSRGLLTEAPKGKAGGRLTPKALEVLGWSES